jgi:putative transcriptional regulator
MKHEAKSLQGQLLLDGGNLAGSWFHRTVVLICQHDPQGAFGLVLNRPTENKLSEVLATDLPDALKSEIVYVGGPVQPEALSYLHSDALLADGNVLAGLQLGHSVEELVSLSEGFSTSRKVRLFAGYAGWSAGQLDDEMRRRAWLTHPASLALVFDLPPAQLWPAILRQKGWRQRLLADSPEDASVN